MSSVLDDGVVGRQAYNRDTMQARTPLRGLPTLAAAAGGVLSAHHLTYLLIHPGADDLHAALERSGHDYLPLAGRITIALALAGVLTLFLRVVSRGPIRRLDTDDPPGLAARLWAIQTIVFLAAEVAERAVAGAPLDDLTRTAVVPVGLAALAVTAVVGAFVLRWLHRVVDAAVASSRPPAARRDALHPPRPTSVTVDRVSSLSGAAGVRGPPLPLPR